MCFGPTKAEQKAAEAQRQAAEAQRRAAAEARAEAAAQRAEVKRDSIEEALTSKQTRRLGGGGKGRRSLLQSPQGAAGFLGRFD